jgi:hypothetical protein
MCVIPVWRECSQHAINLSPELRANARERKLSNGRVSILEQHKTQFRAFS